MSGWLNRAAVSFLIGWLAVAAYIMATAQPSDLPTWLRLVLNGILALTIALRLVFGPPGGFIVYYPENAGLQDER